MTVKPRKVNYILGHSKLIKVKRKNKTKINAILPTGIHPTTSSTLSS